MSMIHELNDSVRGVVTTDDIPINPNVSSAIDMLDDFQVVLLKFQTTAE